MVEGGFWVGSGAGGVGAELGRWLGGCVIVGFGGLW